MRTGIVFGGECFLVDLVEIELSLELFFMGLNNTYKYTPPNSERLNKE